MKGAIDFVGKYASRSDFYFAKMITGMEYLNK